MRVATILVAAVLFSAASPAAAQLRNRSISVESGLSAPFSGDRGHGAAVALGGTAWLEGPLEATVRVALEAAGATEDRPAVEAVTGTAGVRLSLLPDPLRPQLGIEVGWAMNGAAEVGPEHRLAFGLSAGLELFPARDLSVAVRGAVRGAGAALSLELVLGAAAYF